MKQYVTAGPGAIIFSVAAAIFMIAATALFIPPIRSTVEFGTCLSLPLDWLTSQSAFLFNSFLIAIAVVCAFFLNKKFSFVKGSDVLLPVTLCILLSSNPANTSCFSTSIIMLIVNLICLDIMMRSYCSSNATTQMFAVATYLSVGSMIEYAFLPLMLVYPVMAIMTKVLRLKEILAFLMGLVAPYWVALGFGIVGFDDFRLPEFLTVMPDTGADFMIFVYVSLGIMALISLIMTLNNALLFYSGNTRVRTLNNIINLLGITCALCMLIDFGNFEAYTSTFCFASAVQMANFFAIRHIPRSRFWFWALMSLFILIFILSLL